MTARATIAMASSLAACGSVSAVQIDAGPDATPPAATVTVELPPYLDLGATADWKATVVGPAEASIRYAWQVSPSGATRLAPDAASSALDADGKVVLTGTVTAGTAAAKATLELAVTGDAAGTAVSTIEVAAFQTFGYRSAFAQSSGIVLNAGRVLAVPFAMPAGLRVIGFGIRVDSAADVRIGMYGTSGAAPGDLLASSPIISAAVGENVVFLATPQQIDPQPSYLALAANTNLSIAVDADATHALTEFAADIEPGAPLPSPFLQSTSFSGGPTNVFVIAIAP